MSKRCDRRHGAAPDKAGSRDPFERDRDLIRRLPEFQRLRHVTQVMAPGQPGRFHNRLTHSLEVARIGRALAHGLLDRPGGHQAVVSAGGLDPAVVEAACLAHDLGHPPFGHDAEDELNHLLTAAGVPDGFEANAQSFRVVTKLAESEHDLPGMNLTRATLAAILKYPWQRGASSALPTKWGAYASEEADLAWATALLPPGCPLRPSLEAEVMDWADLVAYAVLDFEDFARPGLIPLDRLASDIGERERFLGLVCQRRCISSSDHDALSATLGHLLKDCPVPRLPPTCRQGRNALRCFSQHQIDDAINGVELTAGDDAWLAIMPETRRAIYLLEGLTWHYVIAGDVLKAQRDGQRQIIRELFDSLADAAISSSHLDRFPPADRARLQVADSDAARLRVVADVIASMREGEALHHHR